MDEVPDTLYIGGDESNHAGDRKKGEIIVATFSYNESDTEVRQYPSNRKREQVEKWLSRKGRDYWFTIRAGDQYRHNSQNLPLVIPHVIGYYLRNVHLLNYNCLPKNIHIGLDGELKRDNRDYLQDVLSELINGEIIIRNFVKKKGKRNNMSQLVHAADVKANDLYRSSVEELLNHEKLVRASKWLEPIINY
ncbi:MAG: hypothetical protein ACP5D2_02345 [Candidatus Nanoarchaeia archaeon]